MLALHCASSFALFHVAGRASVRVVARIPVSERLHRFALNGRVAQMMRTLHDVSTSGRDRKNAAAEPERCSRRVEQSDESTTARLPALCPPLAAGVERSQQAEDASMVSDAALNEPVFPTARSIVRSICDRRGG
jgi:hypothetical protein